MYVYIYIYIVDLPIEDCDFPFVVDLSIKRL